MAGSKHNGLMLRATSAAMLAPLVLFCLIYGGVPFMAMMAAALCISIYEWVRMARLSKRPVINGVAGVVYIIVCIAAFSYLRIVYPHGAGLSLALLLCIWASDTGAYFAGKTIGGPKMAPKISPNKTWAGLIGGIVSSAAALGLYVYKAGPFLSAQSGMDLSAPIGAGLIATLILGASITISGQAGDLLISREKRAVGVKDTGSLIPGHGGILDRIDSLLLAGLVFLATLMVLTP